MKAEADRDAVAAGRSPDVAGQQAQSLPERNEGMGWWPIEYFRFAS
jgi:hypothetical protein